MIEMIFLFKNIFMQVILLTYLLETKHNKFINKILVKSIFSSGHGGAHPYLEGIEMPGYIGPCKDSACAWVDNVLSLKNISFLSEIEINDYCGNGYCNLSAGEDSLNCPRDCGSCPIDCVHEADLEPCDGVISFIEIENYMNRWLNGEITINEL